MKRRAKFEKVKKTVSIEADIFYDTFRYADKLALSFSEFTHDALWEKIKKVKEELHEPSYSLEELDAIRDRCAKQILEENKLIQTGVLTSSDLDEAKQKSLEDNK
jgi:hypothetical protein